MRETDKTVRVLLADPDEAIRRLVATILEEEECVCVVAQASTGEETIRLAGEVRPHIIVMDADLPVIDGPQVVRQIKSQMPHVRVIGFSVEGTDPRRREMLAAGAETFLLKGKTSNQALRQAIMGWKNNHGNGQSNDIPPP